MLSGLINSVYTPPSSSYSLEDIALALEMCTGRHPEECQIVTKPLGIPAVFMLKDSTRSKPWKMLWITNDGTLVLYKEAMEHFDVNEGKIDHLLKELGFSLKIRNTNKEEIRETIIGRKLSIKCRCCGQLDWHHESGRACSIHICKTCGETIIREHADGSIHVQPGYK